MNISKKRVAICGIHCECCTFSSLHTQAEDFVIQRGNELLNTYPFTSLYPQFEFIPIVRARALPGGPVSRTFYDTIKNEILTTLKTTAPIDGVFFHWHGALFVEELEDAEADLADAVRDVVGEKCFLGASYDLHGNLSNRIVETLDFLSAYRKAPHDDWFITVERAFKIILDAILEGIKFKKALIRVPILLPGEQTSTQFDPARSLYQQIPRTIKFHHLIDLSILIGYVWADEPRASASVIAYANHAEDCKKAVIEIANSFWAVRNAFQFGMQAGKAHECIQWCKEAKQFPVFISEAGDNPTAGGTGDMTPFLKELLQSGLSNLLYVSMFDPQAIDTCFEAGLGEKVDLHLGGHSGMISNPPIKLSAKIIALHTLNDNNKTTRFALIDVANIHILIAEKRSQFLKIKDFERLKINLKDYSYIIQKIGYIEDEIRSICANHFLALSSGAVSQDIFSLTYKNLNRPLFPFDSEMQWIPEHNILAL